MIHDESLVAVTGDLRVGAGDEGALRSPGLLKKHYSPKARLLVCAWRDERELRAQFDSLGLNPRDAWIIAHTHVPSGSEFEHVSIIPHDAEAFARAIYSELHRADVEGAEAIVVEGVPDTPEWRGIADRLRRAAAE
jgi:L-threonylcarbamoyladenylate synthase